MKSFTLPGNYTIPLFGLGTWKSTKGEVYTAVKEAINIGYRHIDCAPAYENEAEVGQAIADSITSGVITREELWVTSKLWNNAHIPKDVQPGLEKTLSDLQLEYLDLYLIHWPVVFSPDVFFPGSVKDYIPLNDVPTIETWQALEQCVKKGLVRSLGVCNFNIKKLKDLHQEATIKPCVNQIELHPFLQQNKMIDYCQQTNILLTAYSPLGSGDRHPRMKKESEPSLLEDITIKGIAIKYGVTPAQILISWALHRGTAIIPKSVNPERLAQNFEAQNIALDEEDMSMISALDEGYRYVDGSFWEGPGSPYSAADLWD